MRQTAKLLAVVAALAVLVAACSDSKDPVAARDTTTTSTTARSTSTTGASMIDARTPLGPHGLGPVEAGMTLRQAAAASGLALTPNGFGDDEQCFFASLQGQPDISIIVFGKPGTKDPEDGTVASLTIASPLDTGSTGPSSTRLTTAGLGLGATEAAVRAAYPGGIDTEPHEYVPQGAYLYVLPKTDPGFGIRYVLDEHRVVTSIDVGTVDAIHLVEGCS